MALDAVLRAIVTICILVFSAKVLGELFSRKKIPSVLGELFAGILLGPYAFGSIIAIGGTPIIELNEIVRAFGEDDFHRFQTCWLSRFHHWNHRRNCSLHYGLWLFHSFGLQHGSQSSYCRGFGGNKHLHHFAGATRA